MLSLGRTGRGAANMFQPIIVPGDTVFFRFTSGPIATFWGYKFSITPLEWRLNDVQALKGLNFELGTFFILSFFHARRLILLFLKVIGSLNSFSKKDPHLWKMCTLWICMMHWYSQHLTPKTHTHLNKYDYRCGTLGLRRGQRRGVVYSCC